MCAHKETFDSLDYMSLAPIPRSEAGSSEEAWQISRMQSLHFKSKLSRYRLARLRSNLNLEMVRRYACPRTGEQKVAAEKQLYSQAALTWLHASAVQLPEAGGADLKKSSKYPIGLGLKACVACMCAYFSKFNLLAGGCPGERKCESWMN